MAIKIESQAEAKLPSKTEAILSRIFRFLPREHTRGFERIKFVDLISDPRLRTKQTQLPALYHPRQGVQPAWGEIAIGVLLPSSGPFYKKLLPRLSYKNNLAAIAFSLVGQHYYLTLRHSVKKGQLESAIRMYAEKNLRAWHEQENVFLSRLFKPLRPTLERWAISLRRRASKSKP
jgi:hypothetical protein